MIQPLSRNRSLRLIGIVILIALVWAAANAVLARPSELALYRGIEGLVEGAVIAMIVVINEQRQLVKKIAAGWRQAFIIGAAIGIVYAVSRLAVWWIITRYDLLKAPEQSPPLLSDVLLGIAIGLFLCWITRIDNRQKGDQNEN